MKNSFQLNCYSAKEFRSPINPIEDGLLMVMPKGTHCITPSQNGRAVDVTVEIDASAADALQEQFLALKAKGSKPFFSIEHETDVAAFWPDEFFWDGKVDPTGSWVEGVWAKGTWTKSGREAVQGKDFRSFSPVFFVDAIRNDPDNPVHVICCDDAKPNMGALENDPAFIKISPLWAKNAGATGSINKQTNASMDTNKEKIAALQASNEKLELTINGLLHKDDPLSKESLKAARASKSANDMEIQLLGEQEKSAALTAKNQQHSESMADAAVEKMVEAGEIGVREFEVQASWKEKFIKDPSLIELKCGKVSPSHIDRQITPTGTQIEAARGRGARFEIGSQDPRQTLKAMGALCASNAKSESLPDKFKLAAEFSRIYKREIQPLIAKDAGALALVAADYAGADGLSSATLGTLSGTLVAQRTLDFFKVEFPILDAITTDFSDQPAQFDQMTKTRIITKPAVLAYSATPGADGRPAGYVIATQAITTDVNITLSNHNAVAIQFDANTLASTSRQLFVEQAAPAAYALAKDLVDTLYAVITPANFTTNAPISVGATSYGRPTFAQAAKVLNKLGAPMANRFCLSNSDYQQNLIQDPSLVSLAVFQMKELITQSTLPPIAGFQPYEAPNLPATAFGGKTLQAFFGHKSSLLVQSRIPNDWSTVLGASSGYGMASIVTNADTGISALLVQYSNPRSAYAEYRLAWMYGVAAGQQQGGVPVTN